MFFARPADVTRKLEPLADSGDFAERHAGLHHPKWSRIHTEKDDSLWCRGESTDVSLETGPRVLEGIVDMRHWGRES